MKEHDKFEDVVSEALKKGSTFELPQDFADRVVVKIQQAALQREATRDRWLLVAGIASMIGALVFVFVFFKVEFKPTVGVFTFFKGYWGLVVFGTIFATALHLVDKHLLKKQVSG
ncbi:MAG: hypothetical protein WDO15_07110 [Bacteroidota bacterium]